nr:MAG TPA: hypothetical protein [Bacteriophage sp.]
MLACAAGEFTKQILIRSDKNKIMSSDRVCESAIRR